jgi:hypothetical protein
MLACILETTIVGSKWLWMKLSMRPWSKASQLPCSPWASACTLHC